MTTSLQYEERNTDDNGKGRYIGSCIRLDKKLRDDGAVSPSAKLIAAELISHSSKYACKRTYEDFYTIFGYARGTVSNGLKQLEPYIVRERQSTYKAAPDLNGKVLYDKIPDVVFGDLELKNGKTVHLTPSCIIQFGYVFSRCNNKKKGSNAMTTSTRILSELLGMAPSTIGKNFNLLLQTGLLVRDTGVNSRELSTYHVNFRALNKLVKKATAEPMTEAEIKQYYVDRQEINSRKADAAAERMRRDPEYSGMNRLWIQKQLQGFDDFELENKMRIRLKELGLEEAMKRPEYWIKCKRCSDTGVLPSGKRCTCYKRRQ